MLGMEKEFVVLQAAYMIPKNLALAFAAFASGNFWSGMQYTMAAAEWGVAAGAAVKSIASGIGGGGGAAARYAGGGVTAGGIGPAAAATQPQAAGPVINVYIDGVISSDNLNQVIQQINDNVQNGDVHLVSTTTLAPPIVRS
jgi:hypothetical protein